MVLGCGESHGGSIRFVRGMRACRGSAGSVRRDRFGGIYTLADHRRLPHLGWRREGGEAEVELVLGEDTMGVSGVRGV